MFELTPIQEEAIEGIQKHKPSIDLHCAGTLLMDGISKTPETTDPNAFKVVIHNINAIRERISLINGNHVLFEDRSWAKWKGIDSEEADDANDWVQQRAEGN